MQRLFRFARHAFGQRIKHVGRLAQPTALLACRRIDLAPRQTSLSRTTVVADKPGASEKSPVEIPFRYSQGMSASTLLVRLREGGKVWEVKRNLRPRPSTRRFATRGAFTRGVRTPVTGRLRSRE